MIRSSVMASLTAAQVRHIAKLARLQISDAEVETYAKELGSIFTFIEQLKAVDTSGIEPTAQVTGLRNVLRDDRLASGEARGTSDALLRPTSGPTPEELLACSPLPIVEHQIQTPSAHG